MSLERQNDDHAALEAARQGDRTQLEELLAHHRERLRRMVQFRMDRRVQGRVDASDVIQEAYAEAFTRLDEYARDASVPFYVWLRFLTNQKLAQVHRQHLGVQARDAARDVPLGGGATASETSAMLATQLVGQLTTPSEAAVRAEAQAQLQAALEDMDDVDREILVLRHFEQMTHVETAAALEITESAATSRYVRALQRLKGVLSAVPHATGDL